MFYSTSPWAMAVLRGAIRAIFEGLCGVLVPRGGALYMGNSVVLIGSLLCSEATLPMASTKRAYQSWVKIRRSPDPGWWEFPLFPQSWRFYLTPLSCLPCRESPFVFCCPIFCTVPLCGKLASLKKLATLSKSSGRPLCTHRVGRMALWPPFLYSPFRAYIIPQFWRPGIFHFFVFVTDRASWEVGFSLSWIVNSVRLMGVRWF